MRHTLARGGIFHGLLTRVQIPSGTPFNSKELRGFSLPAFSASGAFTVLRIRAETIYGIAHLKPANMCIGLWFAQAHNGSELYISQLYK